MLRGKRGKTFFVQLARPNDSFGIIKQNFVELSRTILVSSSGKKIKKVTILVAFHFMKRRLETLHELSM